MAQCDAQDLGQLLPHAANQNATLDDAAVPAAGSGARSGDGVPTSDEPSASERRDAHVGAPSRALDERDEVSVARAAAQPCVRQRARQNIPLALRRAVLLRDQRRCCVPGCTHATFLDVHHIQPRSGGRNEADNLCTLCSSHHRAVHRGELTMKRRSDGTPELQHADGTT